jgi:hypothetical protein
MNAYYFGLRILQQLVETQDPRILDHAVNCQRPMLPVETRNAEVAKHNGGIPWC